MRNLDFERPPKKFGMEDCTIHYVLWNGPLVADSVRDVADSARLA